MKVNRSFNCAIEPARRALDAPPREPEQWPDTEEFIANGGDYERLPGVGEG